MAARLFFMALTALGGSLAHLLVTPFAGLVSPVLTESGDLSTLVGIMAGGTSLFLLDCLMFRVREAYITVLGREADRVSAEDTSGSEHYNGNTENQMFHFHVSFTS